MTTQQPANRTPSAALKRVLLAIGFALAGLAMATLIAPTGLGVLLIVLACVGVALIVPVGDSGDRYGIAEYLWRLVPANPILLRVVETGGKRRRDLFIRCGYLGLLVVFVIITLFANTDLQNAGLVDLAASSGRIFETMSYLQLALVALLAPIFTAGAITQEKDSQTYDILLATPLTNGQIVLGSLLSRLFFVIALLISGIPIFSITQVFGGVAIRSILYSFLIAAATAFVTGAIAMAIATFKVGTRRTIFSFYLFVVIYLVGLFLLDQLSFFHPMLANGELAQTSVITAFHPFLALRVIFNDPTYTPPDLGALPPDLQGWPVGWMLSSPHTFYVSLMFSLSFALVAPSIILLRRVAQSTVSFRSWLLQRLHLSRGARARKPRVVWNNPIAWREARTKASAFRATMVRYGFIGAGLIGALVLVVMYGTVEEPPVYITRVSYNSVNNTLAIHDHGAVKSYRLDRAAVITLNGKPAGVEAFGEKRAVRGAPIIQRNILTHIDLEDIPRRLPAADARGFLLGAIIVEFAVILLIVTNAAASTVTREKEDGSLDLLLSTPITSRYYIWGKLRGLVMFVVPLIAVPMISALMFVVHDLFRRMSSSGTGFEWIVLPESVVLLPLMMVIVCAFAAILGMQMSLRLRRTVVAVMSSVGIIVGICALLGWCGFSMLQNASNEVALGVAAFSPFTLITVLIDPMRFGGMIFHSGYSAVDENLARLTMFLGTLAAVAIYALIVWAMYKSMVKNFDMTIRRQSR